MAMQRAINQNGEDSYIWIVEKRDGNTYFCPHCKAQVNPRKGDERVHHFAHVPGSACAFSGTGESKKHVDMKENFFKHLKKYRPELKVDMEAILIPGRRADMVIYENDQPFVVEFQASKIEREELIARTKDYSKANIPVLWIFHISRVKLHDFKKNQTGRISNELVYLNNADSLYVLNDKGFIQKCSLRKKANRQETFYINFYNAQRIFKFNKVVMNPPDKQTLYLCQLEKDSIQSEKFYYYGYLFKTNINSLPNYYNVKLELERFIKNGNLYIYDNKDHNNEGVYMFNCFIRLEDSFENRYHLNDGICYLFQNPLTTDEIINLQQVQLSKKNLSDKTKEDNSAYRAKEITIEPTTTPRINGDNIYCPDPQKKNIQQKKVNSKAQNVKAPYLVKKKDVPKLTISNEVNKTSTLQQIAATTNETDENLNKKIQTSKYHTLQNNPIKNRYSETKHQNKKLTIFQKLKNLINNLFK
ncbi:MULTISPECIES: competence protein CoiA [Bacillus cereus group]|uniref:competence protein CoiA n=1 Tax=Bacillus TaxID=1386 RepID=UPI0001A1C5AC|nr:MULTISPECIES: competence protein CoiA family protein [Bacillus cereus group]EEM68425.1 hypothetical protein bthur0009_55370 [Bacillus thuringiensis serovar andalousiensis BGSC 4AW1]MEB9629814.1 competence protein CoiA family protein [Bacillus anthracis]OUB02151.1 hypothetical protein BK714_03105 [Bacillus thuringiensis serovar oswaldocruzi]